MGPPTPDRFTYTLRYGEWQLSVPEPDLTPELRRVVSIVLSGDTRRPGLVVRPTRYSAGRGARESPYPRSVGRAGFGVPGRSR